MKTYTPYTDFTAQNKTISALYGMYAQLEENPDTYMEFTPIVVFMAFSIEAYVNNLGARHLSIWEDLERLPWKTKISILHKSAGKEAVWGESPLQFASEIFMLRDKLAHGKPERVEGPPCFDLGEVDDCLRRELQPDWYTQISRDWVMNAKDRFRLLMKYLGELFGHMESDHLSLSVSGYVEDDGQEG